MEAGGEEGVGMGHGGVALLLLGHFAGVLRRLRAQLEVALRMGRRRCLQFCLLVLIL